MLRLFYAPNCFGYTGARECASFLPSFLWACFFAPPCSLSGLLFVLRSAPPTFFPACVCTNAYTFLVSLIGPGCCTRGLFSRCSCTFPLPFFFFLLVFLRCIDLLDFSFSFEGYARFSPSHFLLSFSVSFACARALSSPHPTLPLFTSSPLVPSVFFFAVSLYLDVGCAVGALILCFLWLSLWLLSTRVDVLHPHPHTLRHVAHICFCQVLCCLFLSLYTPFLCSEPPHFSRHLHLCCVLPPPFHTSTHFSIDVPRPHSPPSYSTLIFHFPLPIALHHHPPPHHIQVHLCLHTYRRRLTGLINA